MSNQLPPLAFVDIDGVYNDHEHSHSHEPVCKIKQRNVTAFNRVLAAVPGLQLVIISSWANTGRKPVITCKHFEWMFATHGMRVTVRDAVRAERVVPGEEAALRAARVAQYIARWGISERYAIIDDLPLGLPRHIRPAHRVGFIDDHVKPTIELLTEWGLNTPI